MQFLDSARIFIKSGAGGNGCASFRREKFVEFGGPNGGDGGQGGNVWAYCDNQFNTLIDYRFKQHFKASSGEGGKGRDRHGKNGEDIILRFPLGTQIFADDGQTLICDLLKVGQKILLLKGGNGGWGNARFKSSITQAPTRANPGEPVQEAALQLRLKLMADIGLAGLPNAGKSTFLAAVTNARPKIADYPFTTLHPNLGVAYSDSREIVIADIPGLIEGASEGKGLGDQFLGHIERCGALLHLTDITEENLINNYHLINKELDQYGSGILKKKTRIVALNKIDALPPEEAKVRQDQFFKETGVKPYLISGVSGAGIRALMHVLHEYVVKAKMTLEQDKEAPVSVLETASEDEMKRGLVADFTVDKIAFVSQFSGLEN